MRKEVYVIFGLVLLLAWVSYIEIEPFRSLKHWHTNKKAIAAKEVEPDLYQVYNKTEGQPVALSIDFLKGKHFWHPQIAIWMEDTSGRYLQTVFITESTAKGQFYSGRTADNYRKFDGKKVSGNKTLREVNALPYWAFKKQFKEKKRDMTEDIDAISGATPANNFYLQKASDSIYVKHSKLRIMMEINVAFDQNEFYSEYDFVDDDIYHNGTGLLGQPSLIYQAVIDKEDMQNYYIMKLIGHGHHSGQTGALYEDLSGITTAAQIVERVVVGVKN